MIQDLIMGCFQNGGMEQDIGLQTRLPVLATARHGVIGRQDSGHIFLGGPRSSQLRRLGLYNSTHLDEIKHEFFGGDIRICMPTKDIGVQHIPLAPRTHLGTAARRRGNKTLATEHFHSFSESIAAHLETVRQVLLNGQNFTLLVFTRGHAKAQYVHHRWHLPPCGLLGTH